MSIRDDILRQHGCRGSQLPLESPTSPPQSAVPLSEGGSMRIRATLIFGALLLLATSHMAAGQGFQGGLRGSIKDAGGVVPGVEVTLTNEQTNIKRSTTTNESGEYNFPNIDPGTYNVKASLQGYKTVERGAIRIGTQQFLTLDLTMEVGAIEENVTVTGQAPLIETSNA